MLGADAGVDWTELAARMLAGRGRRARIAGRYEILGPLGRGGMGAVYVARDHQLGRKVAIKLVVVPRGDQATAQRTRLRHEALLLARLAHPNVVAVFDVCDHEGQLAIVLELVEGADLRVLLAAGEMPWRRVLEIFAAAGRGLAAAHGAGIVHGDVKPDNILVGGARVCIADFGLGAWLAASIDRGGAVVAGTPRYMAPEQLRGDPPGPWTDQFAFCVALREALDGRPAFGADRRPGEAALDRAAGPLAGEVPRAIHRVVERGLAADPHARWPSMEALLAALARASRPRRGPGVLVVAGLLGVAALGFARAEHEGRPCAEPAPVPYTHVARAELEAAVRGLGDGGDWQQIASELDAFAAAFAAASAEVCTADDVRRASGRACLAGMQRAAEARVRLVRDADARGLAGAIQAVASLDDPRACIEPIEPIEPIAADDATAARLAAREAEADALIDAGRYADAERVAAETAANAEAAGRPRVAARARVRRASALDTLARHDEAIAELERAAITAASEDDPELQARAELKQVFVHAVQRGALAEAQTALRHGEAAAVRAGMPPGVAAELAAATAELMLARDDLPGARAARERVLALQQQIHGPDHLVTAVALHNLAVVVFSQGELERARDLYARALAIRIAALGPRHPLVGTTHGNLGPVLQRLGDLAGAEREQLAGLAIAEASFGPEHPRVAIALANLAVLRGVMGQPEAAIADDRRALAILERAYGPDAPNVALVLANLGNRLASIDALDEAERVLARALDIYVASGRGDGLMAAAVRGNLGQVAGQREQWSRAAVWYERAATVFVGGVGPDHDDTLVAHAGWVNALARAGRAPEAVAVGRAALAATSDRADASGLAELRWSVAQAMLAADDAVATRTAAIALALQARADVAPEDRARIDALVAG